MSGFVAMFFVRSLIQSYAWQNNGLSIYNRTLTNTHCRCLNIFLHIQEVEGAEKEDATTEHQEKRKRESS